MSASEMSRLAPEPEKIRLAPGAYRQRFLGLSNEKFVTCLINRDRDLTLFNSR
jgi:hypothetical protein